MVKKKDLADAKPKKIKEVRMDTMELNQRVVPKSNAAFIGTVTRVNPDALSGYVHFDGAEDPNEEVFYTAGELDPAP